MATFKVIEEIDTCIGCGACSVIAPEKWEMDESGKAKLLNSEKKGDNYEKVIDESDMDEYREAVEACPVEALRIENKETGEKIV